MQEYGPKNVSAIVIVAALGYFVDIFDMILFSIISLTSLKSLSLQSDALLSGSRYVCRRFFWGIQGVKQDSL